MRSWRYVVSVGNGGEKPGQDAPTVWGLEPVGHAEIWHLAGAQWTTSDQRSDSPQQRPRLLAPEPQVDHGPLRLLPPPRWPARGQRTRWTEADGRLSSLGASDVEVPRQFGRDEVRPVQDGRDRLVKPSQGALLARQRASLTGYDVRDGRVLRGPVRGD